MIAAPSRARAQNQTSIFERLGLDRLELVSLGGAVGRIDPAQVEPATVFAVAADYGNVGPHWRVVFEASYWESRLSPDVVQTFIDTLKSSIVPPSAGYTVLISRVPVYDVTLSVGTRWTTSQSTLVRPYLGGGLSAHVINAEGKLIKGTFVERALDNIAAGFYVAGGVELRPVPHIVFDGQARADLLSGFRSLQLRVGATYYLGTPRRP